MPSKTMNPRRQLANRSNARHSTGPRTAEGKQTAAQNAVRHRLSVPLDGATLDPLKQKVAGLLLQSDISPVHVDDLAEKIIEFERCMVHFRQIEAHRLYGEDLPDLVKTGHPNETILADIRHLIDMVEDEVEYNVRLQKGLDRSFMRSAARQIVKLTGHVSKLQSTSVLWIDRYLHRAQNQLIKSLRRVQ